MRKKAKITTNGVSIVIPSYNAEKYIYDNLLCLQKILSGTNGNFEIICVVDGATDKTYKKAIEAGHKYKEIKVFGYKKNRGKGYAVRYGMKKTNGSVMGFIDAGQDLDYKDILGLLDRMRKERADIVVGSKRHPDSVVKYPMFRKLYSLGYQLYVKNLFRLSINDTQVGMKLFKNDIIDKILPVLTTNGFAFDIEILAVASRLVNAKIIEAPIHVSLDENSSTIKIKGGFLKNSAVVFWETLKIFYRLNLSGYYKEVILKK